MATTHYIDATTGNDANDGLTTGTPWRSLSKAASIAYGSGDQLLFNRGQSFTRSASTTINFTGSADGYAYVGAYGSGADPVLENTLAGRQTQVLLVTGTGGTFENLKLVRTSPSITGNRTDNGIKITANEIRVTDCEITGTGQGVHMNGNNLRVDHCYIHDLIMVFVGAGSNDDFGASGIVFGGVTGGTIDHNHFLNLRQPSPDYTEDGSGLEIFDTNTTLNIYNNLFDNVLTIMEIGGSTATNVVSGVTFHHNLCINMQDGITVHSGGSSFTIDTRNLKWEHNTFEKVSADNTGFVLGFTGTASALNSYYFRNNIIAFANVGQLTFDIGGVTHTNNLYQLSGVSSMGTGFSLSSGEFLSSAGFIGSGNYGLLSTSPAISKGAALGYSLDYADNVMPHQTHPDVGAYSYIAPEPPPPTPTPEPVLRSTRVDTGPSLLSGQFMAKPQWQRAFSTWMHQANKGNLRVTGQVVLTAGASATTVTDSRAGPASFIGFMPQTARAAQEKPNLVVSSQGNGFFTIEHTNNAFTDRTYIYCIMG